MNDVTTVESLVEQLSNRRAIRATVAHVKVSVEGDQTELLSSLLHESAQRVPGGGVVTAEDHGEGLFNRGQRLGDALVTAFPVGVVDVAMIDNGDILTEVHAARP